MTDFDLPLSYAHVYVVGGAFFAIVSILSAFDAANPRRLINFAFWGLLAASFLGGNYFGDLGNGMLALGLVAVATIGLGQGKPRTSSNDERAASAQRRGNLLFLPALYVAWFRIKPTAGAVQAAATDAPELRLSAAAAAE